LVRVNRYCSEYMSGGNQRRNYREHQQQPKEVVVPQFPHPLRVRQYITGYGYRRQYHQHNYRRLPDNQYQEPDEYRQECREQERECWPPECKQPCPDHKGTEYAGAYTNLPAHIRERVVHNGAYIEPYCVEKVHTQVHERPRQRYTYDGYE